MSSAVQAHATQWQFAREYEPLHPDGARSSVFLQYNCPEQTLDGDWRAHYLVTGLGGDRIRRVMGVDPVQANVMCLQAARAHLAIVPTGCLLTWLGRSGPADLSPPPSRNDHAVPNQLNAVRQTAERACGPSP